MDEKRKILIEIGEGGFGSEAVITVELRNEFPSLDGVITAQKAVVSARRQEKNANRDTGHLMFLKHIVFKKLDDYFRSIGRYEFAHISRPLGSQDNGVYFYEWVFGMEGFPWSHIGDNGASEPTVLSEWKEFVESFISAGIDLERDSVDSDSEISKNIIHELYHSNDVWTGLNCLWKRIDFGSQSVRVNWYEVSGYLQDNEEDLRMVWGENRLAMVGIIVCYLKNREEGYPVSFFDEAMFNSLLREYRVSTVQHLLGHQDKIIKD